MKKIDMESIKKFVNSGKHHEDSVLVISVALSCISIFIMVFVYTLSSVIIMTPFILFALIYYLKFKKIKEPQHKHYDLYVGVGAIAISIAAHCGFFLGLPLSIKEKILYTIILALINLVIIGLMFFVAYRTIKSKGISAIIAGGGAGAGGGALLGMSLSKLVGENIAVVIAFAGFSLVCSMLSICIARYHCAVILERIEDKEKIFDISQIKD